MTPILGKSVATAEQMAAHLLSNNPNPKIDMEPVAFCRLFLYMGALEGVRGDLEFARTCWETNYLKYGGTVTPDQNNYCGHGTTSTTNKGSCFPDEATGMLVQIQHAKGYATSEPLNYECLDDRYKYVKLGSAPNMEDMGGKWAVPGYDTKKYSSLAEANAAKDSYGYKIVNILNEILGISTDEVIVSEEESKVETPTVGMGRCWLTENDCYKAGKTIKPTGIVVHSTGAINPTLRRYVQPDDGIIGANDYNNHWNQGGISKCVHAFIGKDKKGDVRIYQTLPWTMRCWGCGSGSKGSYNNSHIQFEICEDALIDEKYFTKAFEQAINLCAYLCEAYDIPVEEIVSHREANSRGFASNHADCDHWLAKFGKNMDWFRSQVQAKLGNVAAEEKSDLPYKVKVANVATGDVLNIRKEPSSKSEKTGSLAYNDPNTYTIVEEKNGWGRLKSGIGWINLKYTIRA